MTSDVLRLGR